MGFRSMEVENFSLVVIKKLKATYIDMSVISNFIWDAKQISAGFERIKFQHIKRGGNRVANLLATEGFWRKQDVWWIEKAPVVVQKVAKTDRQNIHHPS
ncbi:hypothetical protein PVK06_005656 [Gossypium arboreum]|uniref:RNase H type-1 domain-containing protein n=1 Tax=Gossypium arboreum TaxID=29729 RepID=A0ABR0QV60_GOSAR|nr:hypothetical protein PVK06_005656 [Gossypium arboreum]